MKKLILSVAAAMGALLTTTATCADEPKDATPAVKHVGAADWKKEVEDSKIPVLVDFYATWCGPCQATAPHIEQAAKDYKGKLKVVKVDIDAEPGLAAKQGITHVPTLIIIKDGKVIAKEVGGKNAATLKKFIDDALKSIKP